jgi:transposase-like protein
MAEDYPKSLPEFEERFKTEVSCLAYLVALRWPDGFVCPNCGGKAAWLTVRNLFHCRGCGRQISVTAGTMFHGARKPLTLWFRAMWHVTSQKYGANALGLQRVLGLGGYQTAWEWLHKLRRAMVRPGRDQLSGTIQVDETYIGGKKTGKRGRGAEGKVPVAIAVEDKGAKGLGRIRMAVVADASAESLTAFVTQSIMPGSIVVTDGWKSYRDLGTQNYSHNVCDGTKELPLPHLVASLLKRWLLGTYQGAVRPGCLPYYLDEFTFRFNRRTSASRGKLFYRLVQHALHVDPTPRATLHGFCRNVKANTLDSNCEHE